MYAMCAFRVVCAYTVGEGELIIMPDFTVPNTHSDWLTRFLNMLTQHNQEKKARLAYHFLNMLTQYNHAIRAGCM